MTSLLFVCFGNICRSPMAEFVMKELVRKAGRAGDFYIESAAVTAYNNGLPVHSPARYQLSRHGISCKGKTARQALPGDYARFDLILGMDRGNLRDLRRIFNGDPDGKLHLLLDYTDRPGEEVADPWYTDDYETAYRDVVEGCRGLLAHLTEGADDAG